MRSHSSFTANAVKGDTEIKTQRNSDVSYVVLQDADGLDVWLFFASPKDRLAFMANAVSVFLAEIEREATTTLPASLNRLGTDPSEG